MKLKLIGIGLSLLGGLIGLGETILRDKSLDEKVEQAVRKVLSKN